MGEIQKELSEEVQKREKLETLLQLSHEQLDSTRSKTNLERSEILQSIESKEEQISTLKLQLGKGRHEESSTLAKIHDLEISLMRNVDDLKKSSTENTELKNQLDELQEKIKSTIKEKEDIRTSFQTTLEQIESDCIQAKEEKENMLESLKDKEKEVSLLESQLKASEDKGILMSDEIDDITTNVSTNHKDSMTAQFTT